MVAANRLPEQFYARALIVFPQGEQFVAGEADIYPAAAQISAQLAQWHTKIDQYQRYLKQIN